MEVCKLFEKRDKKGFVANFNRNQMARALIFSYESHGHQICLFMSHPAPMQLNSYQTF